MPRALSLTGAEIRRMKVEKRLHSELFSLSVAPLERGPASTCVVSKKVSPLAAVRNRVKRQCRAAIREAGLPAIPKAFMFTAKKAAAGAPYEAVKSSVETLLQQLSR